MPSWRPRPLACPLGHKAPLGPEHPSRSTPGVLSPSCPCCSALVGRLRLLSRKCLPPRSQQLMGRWKAQPRNQAAGGPTRLQASGEIDHGLLPLKNYVLKASLFQDKFKLTLNNEEHCNYHTNPWNAFSIGKSQWYGPKRKKILASLNGS